MKNRNVILYLVAGLTTLTVIAVLLANLFPGEIGEGNENFRTWGTGAVLAEIIGLFVYLTKTSFGLKHINIFLSLPDELQDYSSSLDWNQPECFIIVKDTKKNIKLLKSDIGPGYSVHLDENISKLILEQDIVEFELKDNSGRDWRVGPFNLYAKTRNLEIISTNNLELNYD